MAHPGGPASHDAEAGVGVTDMLVPAALDAAGLVEEEAAAEEEEELDVGPPRLLKLLLFGAPAPALGRTRRSMVEKADEGAQVVVPMEMPPLLCCDDEFTAAAVEFTAPAAAPDGGATRPSIMRIMGAPGAWPVVGGEGRVGGGE